MKYIVKGKEKGTIFCIHGNSSSAKVYESLLNSNEISHTKVAFDLFGHGDNQPKEVKSLKLMMIFY
jgi:pimeloyl-ACP methyl ester carboxylesterase